jgi:hypothetical protein
MAAEIYTELELKNNQRTFQVPFLPVLLQKETWKLVDYNQNYRWTNSVPVFHVMHSYIIGELTISLVKYDMPYEAKRIKVDTGWWYKTT